MDNRRLATICMLFSSLSFAVMGAFVKAAGSVPVPEKVLVRNLVILVLALALALKTGRPLLGRRGSRSWLIFRAFLGLGGVACYFWAIDHLLLADAAMLNKLSPFVVTVLAAVFLGERISKRVGLALVVAFLGGLLVIKPRFDLTVLPALAALASAFFAGAAYAVVRHLRRLEPPEIIVLWFSAVTVLCLLPVAPGLGALSQTELLFMIGIGVSAAGGQYGLTLAYRHARAAEISILSYSTVVFSALLGLLLWAEVPDTLSLLGGALILGAGVAATRSLRSD